MKLHKNHANEVLIDMSGLLAYSNSMVEEVKEEVVGEKEVYQDETVDLALYMSNYYLNERTPNEETSPLQDQRDFFNEQGKELVAAYYENQLPPIHFKDHHLHDYLTVGDIRLSEYPDELPILSYNEDSKGFTKVYPKTEMELYVNKDEFYQASNSENIYCSIEKESAKPDLNMRAITF